MLIISFHPVISFRGELNVVDPWKVPSGGQFDLNASYKFNIGKCTLLFMVM